MEQQVISSPAEPGRLTLRSAPRMIQERPSPSTPTTLSPAGSHVRARTGGDRLARTVGGGGVPSDEHGGGLPPASHPCLIHRHSGGGPRARIAGDDPPRPARDSLSPHPELPGDIGIAPRFGGRVACASPPAGSRSRVSSTGAENTARTAAAGFSSRPEREIGSSQSLDPDEAKARAPLGPDHSLPLRVSWQST